jgi:RHS repeat-associated protein
VIDASTEDVAGAESPEDLKTPQEEIVPEPFPEPQTAPAPDRITRVYIFLGNVRVATIQDRVHTSGEHERKTIYHLTDHLSGAAIDLTQDGGIEQYSDYLPFGEERIRHKLTDVANQFLFAGKELDAETGLQYFEARYYDSALRRFTEQDPIVWSLGTSSHTLQYLIDPQQLNAYSYVGNRPVIYVDPSGKVTVIVPGTWFDEEEWT